MKTTKQARREAKQLYRLCLSNGLLNESKVRQVVRQISATRPRDYLAALSYFRRLVKLDFAQHSAKVESALPLPVELQTRIQSGLAGIYGPGLCTSFSESLALLGGMRIRVGSDVYDGSVQARLRALEHSF